MKLLNGEELASFIKVRQAKQVRRLRQTDKIIPKLCIIKTVNSSQVINTYVRMKQRYAEDINIEVDVVSCDDDQMKSEIEKANQDQSIQAIVVQLPLENTELTEEIVNSIDSAKDVDGLGERSHYISATAEAIDWLLSGYGVELADKKIVLIGRGKLVGAPLEKLWSARGLEVATIDQSTDQNEAKRTVSSSQVIVSATGSAHLLKSDLVAQKAVVVDAGTVSEDGKIVGDVAPELYNRKDLIITPQKGGVGPLTIVMMFDHVIRACFALADSEKKS